MANDTVRHFLFRNRGDGTFEEVGGGAALRSTALGVTTSGMGVDFAWIHNDDRLAVAVSNFAGEMTALYISQPGADVFFTDEAVATGVSGPTRDRLSFGLLFDDLDLDGRTDMVQANGHLEESINTVQPDQQYLQPAQLFWNAGEEARHVFAPLPNANIGDLAKPIVGRGLASADVDGDGDLDLVLTQVDGPPLLARNDQKLGGHWLRCRLEGPAGNPHAIGAVIKLPRGAWSNVASSCQLVATCRKLSRSSRLAWAAKMVESLSVIWPDGTKQTVAPEGIDREVTIKEHTESFSTLSNIARLIWRTRSSKRRSPCSSEPWKSAPIPRQRNGISVAYLLGGQPDAAIRALGNLAQTNREAFRRNRLFAGFGRNPTVALR